MVGVGLNPKEHPIAFPADGAGLARASWLFHQWRAPRWRAARTLRNEDISRKEIMYEEVYPPDRHFVRGHGSA